MKKCLLLATATALAAALPSPDFDTIDLLNVTESEFDYGDLLSRARGPWNGPVMDISFPDPTLFIDGNVWWAYSTSSDNNGHVPLAASNDGKKWTWAKMDAMPDVGPWVDPQNRGIWAPSVFKNDNGKYVMYFSGQRTGARRCAGVATAEYAQGPFIVTDKPLICDDAGGGVIDPVQFDDGKNRWIIWKVDGNANPTPIRVQRVSRDGLTLQGSPKTILNHNGAADDGLIEGPAMWKRKPGSYVLFFSTHCYNSDKYDIQYAWGTAPDAEFGHRKTLAKSGPNQPIYGPGHMDIASDGTTIAFHGRDKPGNPADTKRRMYIGKIKFPAGEYTEGIKVINYQG